jgi:hypothetical protein
VNFLLASSGFGNPKIYSVSTVLAMYVSDCILMGFALSNNLYELVSSWAYIDSISPFIDGRGNIFQHLVFFTQNCP